MGEVRAHMAAAIERLSRHPDIEVEAVSALYRTPPWGKTDQPHFLNAAVRVDTQLAPSALLQAILAVEQALGRQRAERWGPRTIDIDILLFGKLAVDESGLHVPHPRLTDRAFALAPLVDVMPEAEIAGRPATEWLALSDRAGMERLAEPGWHESA